MKKYDLVIKETLEELIETVNQAVKIGYYPKGGMQVISRRNVEIYVQTIYLREVEDNAHPYDSLDDSYGK